MKGIYHRLNKKIKTTFNKMIGIKWPKDEEVVEVYKKRDETKIIARIKEKGSVNVAFFCMSVSLWKYDTIFKKMQEDPLFNPIIFISPRFDTYRVRKKEASNIVSLCIEKGYPYVQLKSILFYRGVDLSLYDIDMAFYTQPYSNISPINYYYDKLQDSLLCYTPYGYLISKMEHNYVSLLNKIAWRIYMPTVVSTEIAAEFTSHTSNLYALGYVGYDMYNDCKGFKWNNKGLKKIIWAPHSSIQSNSWIHLSSFLVICDYMKILAQKYKNDILIAFKPHPHLFASLCEVWGNKRARDYYNWWAVNDNTILCEGDAYPLFKTSDALIHDCASFLLDYVYTQKPCMYISLDGHLNVNSGEDGIDAYNAHYHAYEKEDIEKFICNVVIGNNDNMKEKRLYVLQKHIATKNGQDATSNIISNIKKSIWGNTSECNEDSKRF